MKIVKKLSDWKTWIFFILPICLLIAWAAILIYVGKNKFINAPLLIFTQLLFIIAVLLLFSPLCLKHFKQKPYFRGILSSVFLLCFLGLQVATTAMLPKLCQLWQANNVAYEEYKEISYEDTDYHDKWEVWREANRKVTSLQFTLEFINIGSNLSLCLACFTAKRPKEESTESNKIEK